MSEGSRFNAILAVSVTAVAYSSGSRKPRAKTVVGEMKRVGIAFALLGLLVGSWWINRSFDEIGDVRVKQSGELNSVEENGVNAAGQVAVVGTRVVGTGMVWAAEANWREDNYYVDRNEIAEPDGTIRTKIRITTAVGRNVVMEWIVNGPCGNTAVSPDGKLLLLRKEGGLTEVRTVPEASLVMDLPIGPIERCEPVWWQFLDDRTVIGTTVVYSPEQWKRKTDPSVGEDNRPPFKGSAILLYDLVEKKLSRVKTQLPPTSEGYRVERICNENAFSMVVGDKEVWVELERR